MLTSKKKRAAIDDNSDTTRTEATILFLRMFPHAARLPLPEGLDIGEAWLLDPDLFY